MFTDNPFSPFMETKVQKTAALNSLFSLCHLVIYIYLFIQISRAHLSPAHSQLSFERRLSLDFFLNEVPNLTEVIYQS